MTEPTKISDLPTDELKALAELHGVDKRYGRDKIVATLIDKIGDDAVPATEPEPEQVEDTEAEDVIEEEPESHVEVENSPEAAPAVPSDDPDTTDEDIANLAAKADEAPAADPDVTPDSEDKNASNQSGGSWDVPGINVTVNTEPQVAVQDAVNAVINRIANGDPDEIGYSYQPYTGTRIGADGKRRPI